jgi:MFS family permease
MTEALSPVVVPAKVGRVGPLYMIGQMGWSVSGAASGVLMQALAAQIAPDDKIGFYTGISVVGAIASTLATIAGGALSDGTRSRLGKRIPWLLVAAAVAITALTFVSTTQSRLPIIIAYGVFQVGVGLWVASLSALLPDKVAPGAMGKASAFGGVGYLIGQTLGAAVGGAFVSQPSIGLIAAPWTMALAAVILAVFLGGPDNRSAVFEKRRAGLVLKALVPPASADFWWAFVGRFLFILAVALPAVFQLFTLTDLIGLTATEAGKMIGLATVCLGLSAAVGVIVTGPMSDRMGRTKPFVAGAALLVALALVPMILHTAVWSFLLYAAVGGLAFGTYISVDQALMVAVLPNKETAARDLGFLSVAQSAPIIIAPIIGGALVSMSGYGAVFVAGLVAALGSALSVVFIKHVR